MKLLLLMPLMALGACREQAPPAPSAEESAQLNEAEALLNEQAQAENGSRPAE